MLALPLAKLAVGVKTAVRFKPVPLIAPSVPPVTTTSPVLPFQLKLEPGFSLKLKVMVAVSPALSADLSLVMLKVGARVSMLIEGVVPAAPTLPTASAYRPAATAMLALPEARSAVGVKTAVRLRPVPLMAPSVPPETTTSPLLPSQVKVSPGSSLKVKVIVAVSPIFRADLLLLMLKVGASVSMACAPSPARLASSTALPAASLKPLPTKLSATVPLATPGVGVTLTV